MKKRFLPLLLVLSMLMPMLLSIQVYAADENTDYGQYDDNTHTYHNCTAAYKYFTGVKRGFYGCFRL